MIALLIPTTAYCSPNMAITLKCLSRSSELQATGKGATGMALRFLLLLAVFARFGFLRFRTVKFGCFPVSPRRPERDGRPCPSGVYYLAVLALAEVA